jgi:hypothetical protein
MEGQPLMDFDQAYITPRMSSATSQAPEQSLCTPATLTGSSINEILRLKDDV